MNADRSSCPDLHTKVGTCVPTVHNMAGRGRGLTVQVESSGMLRGLEGGQAERLRECLRHVACDFERRSTGCAAGCSAGDAAQQPPPPPPRRCMPKGLLAAGGHDIGWRSLRCTPHCG
jgi:hypothetical protein